MSLFENDEYQWRETYFVLFEDRHRPTGQQIRHALEKLDSNYQIGEVRSDDDGRFESLTVISPDDYAAMDISYVSGEDVDAQVAELKQELRHSSLTPEERAKFAILERCNARFDILHFEQIVLGDDAEPEDVLDPASLLMVLERLARLCHGVGIDPQSGALM